MRRLTTPLTALAAVAVAAVAIVILVRDRAAHAPGTATGSAPGLTANATLIRVVDGDTIDATVDGRRERIRLIGIDTPETKKENTPVQCYGPEASAFAASLMPSGTALYLERDVVGRDDYGRLLAYVYRLPDRVFVNAELVRQGYARLLTYPPNVAHVDDFVGAAEEAERAGRGLWAACTLERAG